MRLVTLVDLNAGPLPAVTPPAARNAAWFPIVYQPTPVPPLTGGGSTPVADGVLLEWDAVDSGGAEVIYIIERSPNPAGPWEEVTRTTATRYLYSDGSGQTWYFRIIPTVRGQSGPSEVIEGVPNPVTARLVEIQMTADQATHDATEAQLKAAKALALMGEEYDPARGYVADDVVYLSGKMYRAKQAVPINQPPPNATYWQDVGTVTQAQSTTASAISQLRTDVDEQGNDFAAAITSVRASSGGSGNLVTNADYGRGTEGISIFWNEAGASNYLLMVDSAPGRRVGFFASGAPSVPNASVWWKLARIDAVEVGKRLIGQFRYGGVRDARIMLVFYDGSGNQLPAHTAYGTWNRGSTGAVLNESSYATLSVSGTVPDGAVTAELVFAMRVNAAGDFGHGLRPMVEVAKDGQTVPSPWAPGAGGLGQVTQTLSVGIDGVDGRLKAKQTLTTDVNGNVAGYVSENDGSRSSFSILATVFRVISTLTGMGMEWQDGYLRIWKNAAQLILGHTFGAGDLVLWYGPNVGASNCTKANGKIWFDDSGDAYFGGTVTSGVLTASNQSSAVGNISVSTGPFNSNGNTRVVQFGMTYSRGYNESGTPAPSGTISATVNLERRFGSEAWSVLSSMTVVGERVVYAVEPGGSYPVSLALSGSSTFWDTGGGGNPEYRVTVTNNRGWPVLAGAGTQRTYVGSTEYNP